MKISTIKNKYMDRTLVPSSIWHVPRKRKKMRPNENCLHCETHREKKATPDRHGRNERERKKCKQSEIKRAVQNEEDGFNGFQRSGMEKRTAIAYRNHYVYTPGHNERRFHLLSPIALVCAFWIRLPEHFSNRSVGALFFYFFSSPLSTTGNCMPCASVLSKHFISARICCSPVTFVYQPNDHLCTFSIFLMRFFFPSVCCSSSSFSFSSSFPPFSCRSVVCLLWLPFSTVFVFIARAAIIQHRRWPAHVQPHLGHRILFALFVHVDWTVWPAFMCLCVCVSAFTKMIWSRWPHLNWIIAIPSPVKRLVHLSIFTQRRNQRQYSH